MGLDILLDDRKIEEVISGEPFTEDMKEIIRWLNQICWVHQGGTLRLRRECGFCWLKLEKLGDK